ncbi:MAG TPA: lytic transglycosylase domain-containing protein [Nitrospiraceae bacterium]|nr:lytic transglycosylase domain-containing protein [Nitrospiraceae bacterium]
MAADNTRSGSLCSRLLRTLCALVMACLLIAAVPTPTRPDYDGAHPRYSKQEIHRAIAWYAKKNRLDPALLRAVIKTESDFLQHAVSRKGAVGLMQLTPATAATLRVSDVYDPIQNIRGGAKQLRHLLNLYQGDLPLALAAYNAGIHRVKDRKLPRIRETHTYVRKVLRCYEVFRSHPQPSPKNKKNGERAEGRSRRSVSKRAIRDTHAHRSYLAGPVVSEGE